MCYGVLIDHVCQCVLEKGSALLVGKYAITVWTVSGEQIEYLIQHDSFDDGACSRSCRFAVNIVSEVLVVNLKPEYARLSFNELSPTR